MNSIYEFVKQARGDYYSKVIEVIPGYESSQYEALRTIELTPSAGFLCEARARLSLLWNVRRTFGRS